MSSEIFLKANILNMGKF